MFAASPLMAAKLHLNNCTGKHIEAKSYNSYDDYGIAHSSKGISAGETATVSCATTKCQLKLDDHKRGTHSTGHYIVTGGDEQLSNKVNEDDWVCP